MNPKLSSLKNRVGDVPWMWVIIAIVIAILLIVLGFTLSEKTASMGDQALDLFIGN